MFRRIFSTLSLVLLALVAAGCLEVKQRYTINPDGTGKVTLESIVKTLDFDDPKGGKKKRVDEFVQGVLERSEGVDVWKDVTCKMLPDGRIQFKGTAYFTDLSALNLHEVSLSRFAIEQGNGTSTLVMVQKKKDDEETGEDWDPAADTVTAATGEELQHQIDSVKEQFKMARGMMGMFLEELSEQSTFILPGSVGATQGFTSNADGTVAMNYQGKRVLAILDSISSVPSFWEEMLNDRKNREKLTQNEEEMMRLLFGTPKPQAAYTLDAKPLFDYKAETAAARKKYAAMVRGFGIKK